MSVIPLAEDECLEGQLVPTNKLWMGDVRAAVLERRRHSIISALECFTSAVGAIHGRSIPYCSLRTVWLSRAVDQMDQKLSNRVSLLCTG